MILVNNPGSWAHIYGPLKHAPWHGCTPTDLVFPFFLFAVGNAMAFVMPRLEAAGTAVFLRKVFKRAFLIFFIGFLLHWAPFVRWENDQLVMKELGSVRIFGVLQRIALCYLFASLIVYFFKARGAFVISGILLLAYWVLCLLLGNPADPYSLEGFWGTHVDRAILADTQIYKGEGVPFDPEGLVSTLPAIVQVIFGYLVGQYIRLKSQQGDLPDGTRSSPYYELLTQLFVTAMIFLFAGFCWDMVFPINKKIWTSSYVLYTTGLAMTILAVMIYVIEVRQHRGFITRFFDVFGKNPLFIYVLSGFLPRLLGLIRIFDHTNDKGKPVYLTPFGWFYEYVCKPVSDNLKNGSLLYALSLVLFYWLIVYFMDKKRVYVKV
jgi:predicted acyltransferase